MKPQFEARGFPCLESPFRAFLHEVAPAGASPAVQRSYSEGRRRDRDAVRVRMGAQRIPEDD